MYESLLQQADLYRILQRLDGELAEQARRRGCGCGGKLHRARYRRKPRGAPTEVDVDSSFCWRESLCCAEEGCRRRTTPPSVLFLGRKVYFSVVVVLVCVLRHGATPVRLSRLQKLVGVSARTVQRWRKWWLEIFTETALWRASRGRLRSRVNELQLPLSLLEAFAAREEGERLVRLLLFIRPLSTSCERFGSGF